MSGETAAWPDWSKEMVLYWKAAWMQNVHIQCKKEVMSIQNGFSELIKSIVKVH